MTQDLTTVLPTADDIEAELILAYNGGGAHMIPTSQRFQRFNWIEPSTYSQLAERVVSWGKSIANHLPTGHEFEKVYLWHGVLRILSDDNLTRKIKQLPLAEDHSSDKSMANSKSRMTTFTEETTFGIFQFVLANPYRRFRLQYSLTYSSVLTKRSAGQTRRFEELIRQEVTRLKAKNVNFNNQQFISRPDVDALTSKDVIRQILLEKPDHLLSAEFYKYPETTATRIIEAKASKLFLACIINYRPNFEALTEWQNFQERKKLKYDDGNLPTQVDQLLNEGDLGNLHALHAFFAVNIHDGIDRDVTYEACEVLPVLYVSHDDKNVSLGEGSSGKVSKVRIDPGHHDLSGVSPLQDRRKLLNRLPGSSPGVCPQRILWKARIPARIRDAADSQSLATWAASAYSHSSSKLAAERLQQILHLISVGPRKPSHALRTRNCART